MTHRFVWLCVVSVAGMLSPTRVDASSASRRIAQRHVASIDALEKRLVGLERQVQSLELQRSEAEHAQARARSKQAMATLALARAQRALGHRLGILSRRQPASQAAWRLGAKRLSIWLDEGRLHRAVAEHDHRLMVEVRTQQNALAQATEEQTRAVALARQLELERRTLRESLGRERRRRIDALERLARVDGRRFAVTALVQQGSEQLSAVLDNAQGEVNGRSVALEGRWPGDLPAAPGEMTPRAQAALPWPTAGAVRTRFGDRVDLAFGTVTRQHGIDIAAPAGSRVRAIARGQIVFADWLPGYGQTVIVSHPHQVHSVHAHLSHVAVHTGQGVEAQQSLGFVGDTGSMRGRVLYFEVRKQGRPEDPMRWLMPKRGAH